MAIKVVENFFEDPMGVREFALSQRFDVEQYNFPGKRTLLLDEINPNLLQLFNQQLSTVLFGEDRTSQFTNYAAFQLSSKKYEKGWIHVDYQTDMAGVVYLTPQAPIEMGTSVYAPIMKYEPTEETWKIRNAFYNNQKVDLDEYRRVRDTHNAKYQKTISVGNVFNRLVVYNGYHLHKEDGFFGENNENSRMTLVFFMKMKNSNVVQK